MVVFCGTRLMSVTIIVMSVVIVVIDVDRCGPQTKVFWFSSALDIKLD